MRGCNGCALNMGGGGGRLVALLRRSGKPCTKKAYRFSGTSDVELALRVIRHWQTDDPDELDPEAIRLGADIIKVVFGVVGQSLPYSLSMTTALTEPPPCYDVHQNFQCNSCTFTIYIRTY